MSVAIAARATLYDRQTDAGLVGRFYRQDTEGLTFVAQARVPIADHTNERADPVHALDGASPGRYLLQLLLPSGSVITRPFEIRAGEPTTVEITLPEGPHEWTTLQMLAGQFSARAAAAEAEAAGGPALEARAPSYSQLRQRPSAGFELRFLRIEPMLPDHDSLADVAKLIGEDPSVEDLDAQLEGGDPIVNPVQEDDDFALFEFVDDGSVGDGAAPGYHYFAIGEPRSRAFLLERSAAGLGLVALPVPWTSFGNEVAVQLLLDKRRIDEGEPQYSMTITDPMINSALGYVQNGAVKEAAELVDFRAANKLLFHKMSSPLAAAVGGYLLVLGLDRKAYASQADAWRDWVDNLCNWFPWLPDGAVLKAAKYFVLGDKDRDGALAALMTGYDRGLPFFTFGLNLMLEGMRRFANEGEPLAQQRLRTLEALAAVTDPAHHFVKLRVARRWHASREPEELERHV